DPDDLGVRPQLVHRRQCRVARAPGVILVGDGRSEQRHDAVAGELIDRAFESVDVRGENLEDAIKNAVPLFGAQLIGKSHGIDDVDEQDTHLLALTLERGPNGEYLLGEVTWRVGARIARLRSRAGGRRERLAAGVAKLLAARVGRPATRAR